MYGTFLGLETSKRGLNAQQGALYTTGNNISNANTAGYSRQVVSLKQSQTFPGVGMNAPMVGGTLGTGVDTDAVNRVRDKLVDNQYRQETTRLGYWSSRTEAVSKLEDIFAEPSDYGLNEAFDNFYTALQQLADSPKSAAARQVVTERGNSLADSFNYLSQQLVQTQTNLKSEINVETKNINSILEQIVAINKQIANVEPNGYTPNDLYDARDSLVDELSTYLPIEVTQARNAGNTKDLAEGSYVISMKQKDGTLIPLVTAPKYDPETKTSDGAMHEFNAISLSVVTGVDGTGYTTGTLDSSDTYTPVTEISINGTVFALDNFSQGSGQLFSLISSYGSINTADAPIEVQDENGDLDIEATKLANSTSIVSDKMKELDLLAKAFAEAFNDLHKQGFTLKSDAKDSEAGGDFFDTTKPITASNIKVSNDILSDYNLIAASGGADEEGNNENAVLLSNIKSTKLAALNNASAQTYYESIIGDVGVLGEQAQRMEANAATIQSTVEYNRLSVTSVNLDEEMTNMITFQQAYNASARMITVMDEMLDKIINGMGRVGL